LTFGGSAAFQSSALGETPGELSATRKLAVMHFRPAIRSQLGGDSISPAFNTRTPMELIWNAGTPVTL
jgi:hypothetical protein